MYKVKKIACLGAGYVGGPTMVKIAQKCPEIEVVVLDVDEKRIQAWNGENLPISEPGLKEVVQETLGTNLSFSSNLSEMKDADIIFVAVQTPTKNYGIGKGEAPDLSYWECAASTIKKYAHSGKIIVEKSTVPVGLAKNLSNLLNYGLGEGELPFIVLSNPEFLAEGTIMKDLENPDRVLIGSFMGEEEMEAAETLAEIYAHWVPKEKIIFTDAFSSELSKLASNAFLAQRISSINSLSNLCEKVGADISAVSGIVGMDERIGKKFLKAGPGFGGSCFKKDLLSLIYLMKREGLDLEAEYWEGVLKVNENQPNRIVQRVLKESFQTLKGKRVVVLGYSFKANTGDTRESPAKKIIEFLLKEGAEISVVEVENSSCAQASKDYQEIPEVHAFPLTSIREAIKDAEAILLVTEWKEFCTLGWKEMYTQTKPWCKVFDCRNILDHSLIAEAGFTVFRIGSNEELSHIPF